ncbi:MAG: homoserine kinase [Magnetococcales bacterium]|nr:homoserine kinase [Magnetococcales bacterium]
MSVFTTLSPEQVADLLDRFQIGRLVSLEGIPQGVVNTNYRLTTDRDRYILTLIEDSEQGEALDFATRLMDFLARRRIPVPQPIRDRNQGIIQEVLGHQAIIVTHLPGESPIRPTPGQCAETGDMLARLHRAGEEFPLYRENPMGPGRLAALLERLTPLLSKRQPEAMSLCRESLDALAMGGLFTSALPTGVCHADLFPDNTLFQGERLTGIIDFHFACQAPLVWDLAIAINAWGFTPDGRPDRPCLEALWQAYRESRPPGREEMRLLPQTLGAAALRFALTRLVASYFPRPGEQVTRKPPEEYLERLRFHKEVGLDLGTGQFP